MKWASVFIFDTVYDMGDGQLRPTLIFFNAYRALITHLPFFGAEMQGSVYLKCFFSCMHLFMNTLL